MKAYRESRGIAPLIHNLGARWRWFLNLTPRMVYVRGHNPLHTFNRRLGGSQNRSERLGEYLLSLPGIEILIVCFGPVNCTSLHFVQSLHTEHSSDLNKSRTIFTVMFCVWWGGAEVNIYTSVHLPNVCLALSIAFAWFMYFATRRTEWYWLSDA
jgi:hypothetical protein